MYHSWHTYLVYLFTCYHFRETRTGNTLYQELSFQDSEAIGEVDEGADITGEESTVVNVVYLYFDPLYVLTSTLTVLLPTRTRQN